MLNSHLGSNGHKAAAYARSNFPKLLNNINADEFINNPTQILTNVFAEINSGMNNDTSVDTYMSGTTASVLISIPGKVIIANVGDSRLILGKKDGSAITLSM